MNHKKKFALLAIYTGVFLLGFFGVFFGSKLLSIFVDEPVAGSVNNIQSIISRNAENGKGEVFSVLFLGHGGGGHPGGGLADAWVLAYITPPLRSVYLISIPRDVWVNTPNGEAKINNSFAVGDNMTERANNAKMAAAQVTGLSVDYFVSVDFGGFKELIEQMNGIEVEVPVAFDDFFYPVPGLENEMCGFSPEKVEELHRQFSGFELEREFNCRYEQVSFEKGRMRMDGETALKFVRSRHSAQHGGDFARGQRQQAVLVGMKNKLISVEAIENGRDWFRSFSRTVNTDMDIALLDEGVNLIADPASYTVKKINLGEDVLAASRSQDGQSILIPKAGAGNFSQVHNYLLQQFNR